MLDTALPRRVGGLAAAQERARDRTREQDMCPSDTLVPHHLPSLPKPPSRGNHGHQCTRRARGVYPHYRAGRGA
jgi:hypothetical protein